eukprot:1100340-Pyramimonas_sp.AAC.1
MARRAGRPTSPSKSTAPDPQRSARRRRHRASRSQPLRRWTPCARSNRPTSSSPRTAPDGP